MNRHCIPELSAAGRGVVRAQPAVRAARPDTVVLATGTSCRTQLRDLGLHDALHPIELLADRLVDSMIPVDAPVPQLGRMA